MILRKLYDRLRQLERRATTTPADFSADLADRQKLLALICDDEQAGPLYYAYFDSISGTCPHESIGSCVSCWKSRTNSAEAQHALSQFQDRIHVLQSNTPTNKGE